MEGEVIIVINKVISIDNKWKIRTDAVRVNNINIKSTASKIIDEEDTSTSVEIYKNSKISALEDFEATSK